MLPDPTVALHEPHSKFFNENRWDSSRAALCRSYAPKTAWPKTVRTVFERPKPTPVAPVVAPVENKPDPVDYASMTVAKLRKLASARNLAGRSKLRKAGLVEALLASDAE